ncbi:hypothetical protein IP85_14445 [Rhizobium sp. AAP116]|nr:hypothetical protein IP85_14445 [Rhizobium sp. AAP116]
MEDHDTKQTAAAAEFEPTASDIHDLVAIVNGSAPFGSDIGAAYTTVTEDQIEKVAQHIRKDGARAELIVGSLVRKSKLQFLSRAACWIAEAAKIEGYLEKLMSDSGVAIATNTANEQALNAAVVRFLTSQVTDAHMDKAEVSRAATALAGLQILCTDNGVAPSFGTFHEVLALASTSSCDKLITLARERRKVDQQVSKPRPSDVAPEGTADVAPGSVDAADPARSGPPIDAAVSSGGVAKRPVVSASAATVKTCSEGVRQLVLIVDVPECLSGDQFTFEGRVINGQLHLFLAVNSTDR